MLGGSVHANRVFEPEIILPSQFFRTVPAATERPEKRLMLAVLQDAIATLLKHTGSNRPRARRLVRETQQWISAAEGEWPFSFENICAALDLDAGAMRAGLQRVMHQRPSASLARVVPFSVARHVAGKRHRIAVPRPHHRAAGD